MTENHLLSRFRSFVASCAKSSHEDGRCCARRASAWLDGSDRACLFPVSSIISVLARTEQGQSAETSIVGREGMIGSSAIHGIMTSFAEAIV
jgi:hypothetical protein